MSKLHAIELDLEFYKIALRFQNRKEPLVVRFDTCSRKFYFALIALIVHEMTLQDRLGFIYVRKHEKPLAKLDVSLAGPHVSKTVGGMWEKIRKAWHYSLPDLQEAAHFKIEDRDLVPPYEKGGKYLYECTEKECDIWSSLFSIDNITDKWRFKFAVDAVGLSLNDITLRYGDQQNASAWQAFLDNLENNQTKDKFYSQNTAETSANLIMFPENKEIRNSSPPNRWCTFLKTAILAIIIFVGGVMVLDRYNHPSHLSAEENSGDKPSLAVLPFINVSNDPDNGYFCDGITDEVINILSQVKALRVISRRSAFCFKGKDYNLRTIRNKLNVSHIIEGSVRGFGGKLRLSVRLVSAADDSHLWSKTFEFMMKDIFDTQEKIAQEIASGLKSKLGSQSKESLINTFRGNIRVLGINDI
jgi:adenylate cyclase